MPRKIKQYPNSREMKKKIQAELLALQKKDAEVPAEHPAIQPLVPRASGLRPKEPLNIPLPTIQTLSPRSAVSRVARHLMIGITTYNRPNNLLRLLESLDRTLDEHSRPLVELVIADDGSRSECRQQINEYLLQQFAEQRKYPITYLYGHRRGVAHNKNRCIHAFLSNPLMGELLLLDDDLVFHHNWWHFLEELAATHSTGIFGSLPWHNHLQPSLPVQEESLHLVDGPPKFQISTAINFGHLLWCRRDWLMNARYMNPQFGLYGFEHCLWCNRMNKANGFPMFDFYVPKESYKFWTLEDHHGEDWKQPEEIAASLQTNRSVYRRLLKEYTDAPATGQLILDHRIPDFDKEWASALRYGHNNLSRPKNIPRVLSHALPPHMETYQVKEVPETWKDLPPDGYVTVVLGVRNSRRVASILEVIASLYEQTFPVRVVVVEQDLFPHCRPYLEHKVDTYVFTYSTADYNRSWAFNVGAALAESDLVLLHDCDLVPPEDYIESAKKLMAAEKTQAVIPWGTIKYLSKHSSEHWPLPSPVVEKIATSKQNIRGGSLLIERKFFNQLGGMDESFWGWGGEDDLFYNAMQRFGKVSIPSPTQGSELVHLWHPSSYKQEPHEVNIRHLKKLQGMSNADFLEHIKNQTNGDPYKVRRHQPLRPRLKTSVPRKLHIIYDVEGWAYWHRAKALQKYAPPHWQVTFSTSPTMPHTVFDVVLCLCYGQIDTLHQVLRNKPTSLVGGFNVGWPRRLDHLLKLQAKCDHVLINNHDCWSRAGSLPYTHTISNGVEGEVFRVTNLKLDRRKQVLWIGSEYHADLKGWPNPLKQVGEILKNRGITCDFRVIDPRSSKRMEHAELCQWYNSGGIYICASTSEGTPNPLLESAACGVVPVSTPVGNVPELVRHKENGYVVSGRTVDEFVQGVQYVHDNFSKLQTEMLKSIEEWKWVNRAGAYFDWFDAIVDGSPYGLDSILQGERSNFVSIDDESH